MNPSNRGSQKPTQRAGAVTIAEPFIVPVPDSSVFVPLVGCQIHGQAAYQFDLAYLHRQAGDLDRTVECARRAVELDRSFQMRVLDHPALEPLRASWSRES